MDKYLGLIWVLAASFATAVDADDVNFSRIDCLKATGAVETAICADPKLIELDGELDRVIVDFCNDQNVHQGQRDREIAQQKLWLNARVACAGDLECLGNVYAARLEQLQPTLPTLLIETDQEDGLSYFNYSRHSKWLNSEVVLTVSAEIINDPALSDFMSHEMLAAEKNYEEMIYAGKSGLYERHGLYFDLNNDRFISLRAYAGSFWGDGQPIWSQKAYIFERQGQKIIPFVDLFLPEELDKVREVMAQAVVEEAKKMMGLMSQNGLPENDVAAYFSEKLDEIPKKSMEEWVDVGLIDRDLDGKADRFSVYADSRDYLPFDENYVFNSVDIDVKPFLPFIKPEYRDIFGS